MLTITERAQLQEILKMILTDDYRQKKSADWTREFGCQFNSMDRTGNRMENRTDLNGNGLNTTVENEKLNENHEEKENPWKKKVESLLEEQRTSVIGDESSDDESIKTFHADKDDLSASEDDSVECVASKTSKADQDQTPDQSIDIQDGQMANDQNTDFEKNQNYDFIGMSIR